MEIRVLCQFEKKRLLVGTLRREHGTYLFAYNKSWLEYRANLPIGPDLPLHTKEYRSSKLFAAFERRIPPQDSENYEHYCKQRGISVNETDQMVLLGTIGHMGASSFVFEIDQRKEREEQVLNAIKELVGALSYDIVAAGFGVNKTGLYKLLGGQVKPEKSGIYDLLELCMFNRQAAVWKIKQSLLLPDLTKKKLMDEL
jgi:HipA-like protein